jgi:AraC-like DNA-binding protein
LCEVPVSGSRRHPTDDFDFEGVGSDARAWLDAAYGTDLRLTGPVGTVRHQRQDHGSVAFDHVVVGEQVHIDSDPMPVLVVVDVLDGELQYTRDLRTDLGRDGDSLLASGWEMPFTARSDGYEVRATTLTAQILTRAVEDVDPDRSWNDVSFTSYVPRSPAAGARWRATVDELSGSFPAPGATLAHAGAAHLIAATLLQTFPNTLVDGAGRHDRRRAERDASASLVARASGLIEERAHEDLGLGTIALECGVSPRALQYAFRRHLDCTPLAYLRRVRLDLARQALRDGSSATVSDAASRFGFFNPGRFASEFRTLFGENPGQTLMRASS